MRVTEDVTLSGVSLASLYFVTCTSERAPIAYMKQASLLFASLAH